MFENWQKMVSNNQKRKVVVAKNATPKNQKSTDLDIWKKDDSNREQSSGVMFYENRID